MSEYHDNVVRAMAVLLINEYPNILREELDRADIDPDVVTSWDATEVEEKSSLEV